MAFPVVQSVTETAGNNAGSSGSVTFDYPTTVTSGDLLLLVLTSESNGTVSVSSLPSGYTALWDSSVGTSSSHKAVAAWKLADGTEGGGTDTVTLSPTSNEGFAVQLLRITGWEGTSSGIDAGASVSNGSASSAVPGGVTASWGSDDNLFICVFHLIDDNGFVSAAPTNYTDLVATVSTNLNTNEGASVNTARRELASASDTPGSATFSELEGYAVNSLVVRPGSSGGGPSPPPPPPTASALGETSLMASLGATVSQTEPWTSGFYALVATVGPAAEAAENSQIAAVAAVNGDLTVPSSSQVVALVAYGTGLPERNEQRAWFYDLDGHTNYVLDLGTSRTLVFDLVTEQWAQYGTEGYPIWNAQLGIEWIDRTVCADIQSPAIFELDPRESLDEGFRAIRRKATAIVPSPSRNWTAMDAIHLIASVGDAQSGFAGTAEMTLRVSDDQGQTFEELETITLSTEDSNQEIIFGSLGSFNMPGRVVEFEDLGGPVRIDSAQVVLR